jgi:putative oxidoreductase
LNKQGIKLFNKLNMKNLKIIGRVLFGLPFGILGLNHFFMKNYYLGMVTSFIPGSGYSILVVGIVLILVSVSIILNKYIRTACITLAILLALFIVTIHIPNIFVKENSTIAMIDLMKDTALMGGALLIAGLYGNKIQIKN